MPLSLSRGLPITNRGLFSSKILNNTRGLRDIEKIKLFRNNFFYDEEFETLINQDIDLIFNFSPNTNDRLNKVYEKYSDLYGNNINFFMDKMKDKHFWSGGKLEKEDILNELRDRKYWQKNRHKRPDKFKYAKEINIDNVL
jgi:hypothetical protein